MISIEDFFPAGLPPARAEPMLRSGYQLKHILTWQDIEHILAVSCFVGPGTDAINSALGLPDPGPSRVCVLSNGESVWRVPRRTRLTELRQRLAGTTLRIEALEDVHPPVAELARLLSFPGHTVYINAYAAWGDSRGLALHYDYHDNLVLQLEGRKHWQIYRPTRPAQRGADSAAYKEGIQAAARGEATGSHGELARVRAGLFWEGDLVAGDILYIPPGWFHDVKPIGEATLHLTCEFGVPGEPFPESVSLDLPGALLGAGQAVESMSRGVAGR